MVRLGMFLGVFAVMAALEAAAPMRERALGRGARWASNLGIVVLNTVVVRVLFPTAAVGAAMHAQAEGWGLLNMVGWPLWLEILIAFVILDLAIWIQHVVFHQVPWLWRLHMVHHADRDMDVTTGLRFHPIEIALSMLIKIALVYALGAAALAVVIFEVALNASAMWSHANLRMPAGLERVVRWVVVTPDMHRSHHSVIRAEHDSNYGFFLSVWDRLFRTYTQDPAGGHLGMKVGLPTWRDRRPAQILWMLTAPFRPMK